MPLPEPIAALRTGVAFGERSQLGVVRVRGSQAFDAVDAVCPRALFLRDGQSLHTVLLDEHGHLYADVYVCCDDLDYVLLVEGPTSADLVTWISDHLPAGLDAEIVDDSVTHAIIGLDGPYCWEWLGRLVGPDVVGVPYLGLFFLPDHGGWALRAGKTGEYGYDLVVPRHAADDLRRRLAEVGADLGAREVGLDDLDLCALENGILSMRTPGVRALSPVEMQLQWRVDYRRTFPGIEGLRRARDANPRRVTRFRGAVGAEVPRRGSDVFLDGAPIGTVLEARPSHVLDAPIGLLLLDRPLAHPGLAVLIDGGRYDTASSPLLHNRSLFLDVQRHAFATRDTDVFPPIAPARR